MAVRLSSVRSVVTLVLVLLLSCVRHFLVVTLLGWCWFEGGGFCVACL